MKLTKNVFVIVIGLIHIIGCEKKASTITTSSGITYEYIEHGDGDFVQPGEFLLLNIEYKDENDSVWMSSLERGSPMVLPKKDSAWKKNDGNINEIFYNLVKGDSITFKMNAAFLFVKTFYTPLPSYVEPSMNVTFQVGVEEVYTREEFIIFQKIQRHKMELEFEAARVKQDSIDSSIIDTYLLEKGLEAKETESGLRYIIIKEGSGVYPKNGDDVLVNYTGKTLEGLFFDSSIKSKAEEIGVYNPQREPYNPFQFTLGNGSVIRGWDEGIKLINPGSKVILIIPSSLGYGSREVGGKIPPNSILHFEVELLEIINGNNK